MHRLAAAPALSASPAHDLRWPGRRAAAAGFLSYAGLAVLLFHDAWASPTTRYIGEWHDWRVINWFLQWGAKAVATDPGSLFVTHHLNWPDGVNLMWNSSMPLVGVVLAPVSWLFGPALAWNLTVTGMVSVSAWTAFMCLRRYVHRDLAAWMAGLVFGFSPFVITRSLGHPNVGSVALLPVLVVLIDEAVVRQRRRPQQLGALLGAVTGVQVWIWGETLVAAMFFGPQRADQGQLHAPTGFSIDPLSLVVPTRVQALAPDAAVDLTERFTGNVIESGGYLGLPLIVVVVWTLWRYRARPAARVAALVLVAGLVFSFGDRLHWAGRVLDVPLPWALVDKVPFVHNVLPSRFPPFTALAAAFAVGVFTDEALARRGRARWVLAGGLALAVLSLLPTSDFPVDRPRVPAFFRSAAVERIPEGAVALVAPYTTGENLQAMVWQAEAGLRFRMVGGYYIAPGPSFGPPFSSTLTVLEDLRRRGRAPREGGALEADFRRELDELGVDVVIVGPGAHRAATERFFARVLGHEAVRVGGVALWEDVGVR